MAWNRMLGAVAAAALMAVVSACNNGTDAKTDAPAAQEQRVATAPEGRTMAPGAVTRSLQGRGFTPTNVRRRGDTYVVDATSRNGNQVRMVVDGRRGQIRGMDVRRWAPGQRRIARGSRGNGFVNDAYEFGVTLDDAYLADWVVYDEASWDSTDAWIEYEDVTDWEWSEVTYEESIEEWSYEEYEAEYGAIETYEESFYEEEYWEETYAEEELSYESEEEFAEDLSEEYGEEYSSEYAEYEEVYEEQWAEDTTEEYSEESSAGEEAYADESYEEEAAAEESYEEPAYEEPAYEEEAAYDDGGGEEAYDDGGGGEE